MHKKALCLEGFLNDYRFYSFTKELVSIAPFPFTLTLYNPAGQPAEGSMKLLPFALLRYITVPAEFISVSPLPQLHLVAVSRMI